MKIRTIQPLKIWEMLQVKGVYRCDPARVDNDFTEAYG